MPRPHPAIRRATSPLVRAVALTAVLGVSLAGCGSKNNSGSNTAQSSPEPVNNAAAGSSGPRSAEVTVTDANGCSSNVTSFPAGPLTVNIKNQDATAVSEVELLSGQRIIAEKENLPPGFAGSFSVNLDAGTYTLYCPGAKTENSAWTVTGTAPGSAAGGTVDQMLSEGAAAYAKYVNDQVGYLVDSTKALATALHGTDLTAAQDAYMKARPYYEKIEPVVESFTVGDVNLDAAIDARADDVAAGKWTGFHRIEKGLFQDKSLDGLGTYGDGLVENVTKLQTLTAGLTYKPYELANGAQELLDEVSKTKITGEEERYSHIDILDISGNDEGAEQAFASLLPALKQIDSSLSDTISAAFKSLDDLVDSYRTGSNASGFQLYSSISDADRQKIAAAVKAVQEPLSRVAQKVSNA
jgi:iron uptake system component EfeO